MKSIFSFFHLKKSKGRHNSAPDSTDLNDASGHSTDDVEVHYNSSRPAQLNDNVYAQGTPIHLAPGHEHHLPHETWHVVQQENSEGSSLEDTPEED